VVRVLFELQETDWVSFCRRLSDLGMFRSVALVDKFSLSLNQGVWDSGVSKAGVDGPSSTRSRQETMTGGGCVYELQIVDKNGLPVDARGRATADQRAKHDAFAVEARQVFERNSPSAKKVKRKMYLGGVKVFKRRELK
jgi:hypothetical protein